MTEKWKIYRNYQYKISNFGRIVNINSGIEKKKTIDSYGYEVTTLFKDGMRRQFKIHRLVAELFVDGFDENLTVNHIDGNKLNNKHKNLEWVTNLKNTNHAITNGLFTNSLTRKEVSEIRKTVVRHCKINGIIPLSKKYGVHAGTISRIVNNKIGVEGKTMPQTKGRIYE